MPDTVQDTGPDLQMEYGIEPDIVEPKDVAPEIQLDYGIMPDTVQPADTIDCDTVCCECEYGVIPDEVWKKCCEPDPCEDVCCECDYGEPPPPECCD